MKAPGFGDRRKAMLEDIAILTGGQVISEDLGIKLENVTLAMLGKAKKVLIEKENTTVVEGAGKADDINADGSINEADGVTVIASNVVRDAHSAGLMVHMYTFRDDVPMARDYAGDAALEYRQIYAMGVDGVFSDYPDTAYAARESMAAGVWPAVEYTLDGSRYFRTTSLAEIAYVGAGKAGQWQSTGDRFHVWSRAADNAAASPVCRIWSSNGTRHRYSIVASECAAWRAEAGAVDEGVAFYAVPASGGACPASTRPVDRLRTSVGGLVHERYVVSATESAAMSAKGWTRVGVGFCAAT